MKMATFKNLAEIQKYLEKNAAEVLRGSMALERVLADEMSSAVMTEVYNAYPHPPTYDRRGNAGGLADTRNMVISNVVVEGNSVRLSFENLTEGSDNMKDLYITDTIEEGIRANWDTPGAPGTPYSEPRPFVAETIRRLKENPMGMIIAIKSGLREKGMRVKN